MANTRPNIIVPAATIVDLYATAVITVGVQIVVKMIGEGNAKLYSGATLTGEPDDSTGFYPIYERESKSNDAGDLGAFIWSHHGCTINVEVA